MRTGQGERPGRKKKEEGKVKALLVKDCVAYGSGLEDWKNLAANAKTEASKALVESLKSNSFTASEQATLRRGSIPAQTVEILDVYDQAEVAHLYATPTLSCMMALVRAINFDGETVEVVVQLSKLAGMPDETDFAKKLIQCAGQWRDKINNAGHD